MKIKIAIFLLIIFCVPHIKSQDIDLESLPAVDDYLVYRSNPEADTVLITLHGGPFEKLSQGEFDFLESIPTFSVVDMMKYHHFKNGILEDTTVTLEQAVAINDTTVAMIKKAVDHFVSEGKEVVVIGHSFGGYLIHEYLDDYGIQYEHKVISLGSRLNFNQILVDFMLMGHLVEFDADGLSIDIDQIASDEFKTTLTFIVSMAQNRYVDSLGMMDLSKLLMVTGKLDRSVGRLLPEELEMLDNTNASSLVLENGGHNDPISSQESLIAILDFIRRCELSTVSTSQEKLDDYQIYPTVTTGILNIKSENGSRLNIHTLTGEMMLSKPINSQHQIVQLPSLPNGTYIAVLRMNDDKLIVRKIIYQN